LRKIAGTPASHVKHRRASLLIDLADQIFPLQTGTPTHID